MNTVKRLFLAILFLPLVCLAQDEDPFALEGVEEEAMEEQPAVEDTVTVGVYYLDDDAFRYGKYTGLTDDGVEPLIDFRIDERPQWDSGDTRRWRLEGWRLGLDSRRMEFTWHDQGVQAFSAEYRQIPNNRIGDGQTPYRGVGGGTLTLAPGWEVAPGSSSTEGFTNLAASLAKLEIDTERKRLDLAYNLKLSRSWSFNVDYKHETKDGTRTIGSLFGYTGGNPRSVILPAPVDYSYDNVEAMFSFGTARLQAGFGVYLSYFSNDETALVWQNAFGRQSQWDESVQYPDSQGRLALEPDNSHWQFKGYVGMNFSPATRLTADLAIGSMEQDEPLLPYTINPELEVHTPVPLANADAQIDTTLLNVRFTAQPLRRLGLAVNWNYDDRDNKTPRAIYPYIGGDSQDQRPDEDGRINLPYSYERSKADAIATLRLKGRTRIKGGVEYSDISREYSEVAGADEWSWVGGIRVNPLETTSFSFDVRSSSRDVDAYIDNLPLVESHIPGTVEEDEFENHPLLRKYFLTDRDRDEYRLRADFYPDPQVNFGLSASRFNDDYNDGFFGLNEAEVSAVSLDFGWYPRENVSLLAYYTMEEYDASQSSRSFSPFPPTSVDDPDRDWFADTSDDVDTWNLSLTFSDIGADRGWNGIDIGFDYTVSNVSSVIDVTATTFETAPLPELKTDMSSVSAWARFSVGEHASVRMALEASELDTTDFALDGVVPDTLSNVLLLGNSAANYDIILISAALTWRF